MKKFFIALACILPVLGLSSCSDDDKDLPDVDFDLVFSGGESYENQLYVVADSTFSIDQLNIINNDKGKTAVIPYADYYINGVFIGRSVVAPFGIAISTEQLEMPAGQYTLHIGCPVYAEDKSVAFASLSYTLNVVPTAEDMPQAGAATDHVTPRMQSNDPGK